MNKVLIGAVMLAVGLGGTVLAQVPKQSVLKVALNRQYQFSTNFTPAKMEWKTKKDKVTDATIISAISRVLNHGFSSKAQLVIDNAILSGFENPMPGAELVNFPVAYDRTGVNQAEGYEILPGKAQPLTRIFVRDPVAGSFKFVDVTRFFKIEVHECYDCFYLNSFITDTVIKFGATVGPPCCSGSSGISSATGTDRYYMCIEFDNTTWNEEMDGADFAIVTAAGVEIDTVTAEALDPREDGITPNVFPVLGNKDQSILRFRVCGIMAYKWKLKEDTYLGTGTLPARGYGFIKKVCSLLDGKITLSEYFTTGKGNKTAAPEDAYDWSLDIEDIWGMQYRYTFYYDTAPYFLGGDSSGE